MLDEYLPEYEKYFCKLRVKTSLELLKDFGIRGLRDEARGEEIVKKIVMVSRHKVVKDYVHGGKE